MKRVIIGIKCANTTNYYNLDSLTTRENGRRYLQCDLKPYVVMILHGMEKIFIQILDFLAFEIHALIKGCKTML